MPQAIKDAARDERDPRARSARRCSRDHVPDHDALMVERMKAAGCIVVGKTNTPEFGLGSHTFNEVFGVTRNAFDRTQIRRRQQRRRRGRAGARTCCRSPTAATSWEACATRPAGTTSTASGRARAACRAGRRADVWVALLSTEGPMARTVKDVAALLDVQAGWDARVPLSIAAKESYAAQRRRLRPARRSHRLARRPRRPSRDGARHPRRSAPRARADRIGRRQRRADRRSASIPSASGRRWLTWRRWSVAARIAPHLANPANRARIKPEALWEYDQGAGAHRHADRPGRGRADAPSTRACWRCSSATTCSRCRARRSGRSRPSGAGRKSIAGRTMDTYHRWMEVVIYATLAGPAVHRDAGRLRQGERLADGRAADRPPARRPRRAAARARVRADRRRPVEERRAGRTRPRRARR